VIGRLIVTLIFLILIFSNLTVAQSSDKVFDFFFNIYRNDTVELQKFSVIEGTANILATELGEYKIRLLSSEGGILFESHLQIEFQRIREVIDLMEQ
jgi:hypothetical protein